MTVLVNSSGAEQTLTLNAQGYETVEMHLTDSAHNLEQVPVDNLCFRRASKASGKKRCHPGDEPSPKWLKRMRKAAGISPAAFFET